MGAPQAEPERERLANVAVVADNQHAHIAPLARGPGYQAPACGFSSMRRRQNRKRTANSAWRDGALMFGSNEIDWPNVAAVMLLLGTL